MDALDRLAGPARDLLSRVDATLTRGGAPEDHPLWVLVRRLGTLPGEAVGAVAALSPAPLAAAGPALRTISGRYAEPPGTLPDWRGPAAEAFTARWAALSAHVEHGLAGQLAETASFADAVAGWVSRTRLAVARTLAVVLTSAEAVTIGYGGEPAEVLRAAADIAARVLDTVAGAYAEAEELLETWSGRLGELPLTPAPPGAPGAPGPPGPPASPATGRVDIPR
jgi:hypothetical protein